MKLFSILLTFSFFAYSYGFSAGDYLVRGIFKEKDSKKYIVIHEDTNSEQWLELSQSPKGFNFQMHRELEYIMKIKINKQCSLNCQVKLLEIKESMPFVNI